MIQLRLLIAIIFLIALVALGTWRALPYLLDFFELSITTTKNGTITIACSANCSKHNYDGTPHRHNAIMLVKKYMEDGTYYVDSAGARDFNIYVISQGYIQDRIFSIASIAFYIAVHMLFLFSIAFFFLIIFPKLRSRSRFAVLGIFLLFTTFACWVDLINLLLFSSVSDVYYSFLYCWAAFVLNMYMLVISDLKRDCVTWWSIRIRIGINKAGHWSLFIDWPPNTSWYYFVQSFVKHLDQYFERDNISRGTRL